MSSTRSTKRRSSASSWRASTAAVMSMSVPAKPVIAPPAPGRPTALPESQAVRPSGRSTRNSSWSSRLSRTAARHSATTRSRSSGWIARAQPEPSASSGVIPAYSHHRALTNTHEPSASVSNTPTGSRWSIASGSPVTVAAGARARPSGARRRLAEAPRRAAPVIRSPLVTTAQRCPSVWCVHTTQSYPPDLPVRVSAPVGAVGVGQTRQPRPDVPLQQIALPALARSAVLPCARPAGRSGAHLERCRRRSRGSGTVSRSSTPSSTPASPRRQRATRSSSSSAEHAERTRARSTRFPAGLLARLLGEAHRLSVVKAVSCGGFGLLGALHFVVRVALVRDGRCRRRSRRVGRL